MTKQKILDRISKLLARAKSDNPHEAALAAAMALKVLLGTEVLLALARSVTKAMSVRASSRAQAEATPR